MSTKENKAGERDTPTVEQYTAIKDQLTKQILKKQELEAQLTDLEDYIHERENEYFNESTYGSIVKGYENFSRSSSGLNKKRVQYTDEDHIFSLSSVNYVKSLMKRQGLPVGGSGGSKEDLDDYEDLVDPGNQAAGNAASNGNHGGGADADAASDSGGTPGRKRKTRASDE